MQELEIQPFPNTRPIGKFLAGVMVKRQVEVTRKKLATEELAATLRVAPQTIRAGLCRKGHYCGLKPLKLPTGKLLWDADAVEMLLSGDGV
jgi:hypothetical protein